MDTPKMCLFKKVVEKKLRTRIEQKAARMAGSVLGYFNLDKGTPPGRRKKKPDNFTSGKGSKLLT